MKKILLLATLMATLSATAQDYKKMSHYIRQTVHQTLSAAKARGTEAAQQPERTMTVFIKGPEEAVKDYCLCHQGNIHICRVPLNSIPTLSEDRRIERIETSPMQCTANLDSTATAVSAYKIWQGTGLPQAYDGTGVVVGVVDSGIDYLHPTFRSAKDGRIRIVRAWDMLDFSAGQPADPQSNIPVGLFLNDTTAIKQKGATADSHLTFHGTHTTSTAAGSGCDTPWRGMAPEADIYSVSVALSDNQELIPEGYEDFFNTATTLLAFQNIFNYAESVGKPCVINYSISTTQDMTDADILYEEYLQTIIKPGHIIVASAGNNGQMAGYLPKSAADTSVGGRMESTRGSFTINVSTTGKLLMHISRNDKDGQTRKTYALDFMPNNTAATSPSGLQWYDYYTEGAIPELDNMRITIYSGEDGFDNSRVGYDIFIYKGDKAFNEGYYTVEFEGAGTEAEIFAQYASITAATGYNPTLKGAQPHSGNMLSPGALPGIIAAGYTVHRSRYTNYLGQNTIIGEGAQGKINIKSSRGPTLHGFTKPDITAPGTLMAAAMSRGFYQHRGGDAQPLTVGFTTADGEQFPWAVSSGTSMAAPVVTGTIALWLQADPTLTKERITEIFSRTAHHPDTTLPYPNNTYGHGEIDAYRGLLDILGLTNVSGLSTKHLQGVTILPASDGTVTITLNQPADIPTPCRVYSAAGSLLQATTIPPHTTAHTITLGNHSGIVAIQIGNIGSTLIRLP